MKKNPQIIYNANNYASWIIDLVKPEILNSLNAVPYWCQHKNHKCYQCGRYGHIKKDCNKVCPLCNNIHNSPVCLPSLLTEVTKISLAVSKIQRQEELLGVYKNSLERINKRIKKDVKSALGSTNLEEVKNIQLYYQKTGEKDNNTLILTQSQDTAFCLKAQNKKNFFSFFKQKGTLITRFHGIDLSSKPPEVYGVQLPLTISYQGQWKKYNYVPVYLEKTYTGFRFKYWKPPVIVTWKLRKYRNAVISVRHAEIGKQTFLQHQAQREKLKMKLSNIQHQFVARYNHIKDIEKYMKESNKIIKKREVVEQRMRQVEEKYQRVKAETTRMYQQVNRQQAAITKAAQQMKSDLNNHITLSITQAKKIKKELKITTITAGLEKDKSKLKSMLENHVDYCEEGQAKVRKLQEKIKRKEQQLRNWKH